MGHGNVRIITVNETLHRTLPNHDKVPLFEWIGKNVGIRHATGDYVIATNPDIVFSEPLLTFVSSPNNLDSNNFYRVDRYDVSREIPISVSENIEAFCASNWSRIHTSSGSFDRAEYEVPPQRGLRQRYRLFGTKNGTSDAEILHTNGSGDFLLMSSDNWKKLRGYPELKTIDHVDNYMCFLAGIYMKQDILKFPIYHQDHSRVDQKGKPRTDFNEILQIKIQEIFFLS